MKNPASNDEQDARYSEVRYEASGPLVEMLNHVGVSLLVSTYQAGKVLSLGSHNGQTQVSFLHFDKAMGIAADRTRVAIGSKRQINFPHSAPRIEPRGSHDGCWVTFSTA